MARRKKAKKFGKFDPKKSRALTEKYWDARTRERKLQVEVGITREHYTGGFLAVACVRGHWRKTKRLGCGYSKIKATPKEAIASALKDLIAEGRLK